MATKPQVKFYLDQGRIDKMMRIFQDQGVNLSEGLTRLVDVLITAPDEMIPILLRQTPGVASFQVARRVVEQAGATPEQQKMIRQILDKIAADQEQRNKKGKAAG